MPRWFQRLLLFLLVLLAVATGALFAFGDRIAGTIVHRVIARITASAAGRGVRIERVTYAKAAFAGLGVIRCDGLQALAHVDPGVLGVGRASMTFDATQLVVDAGWPWSDQARVSLLDGNLVAVDSASQPTGEQLTRVRVQVSFPFSWWHPMAAAPTVEAEARSLMREGRTSLPLELSAMANFRVAAHRHELPVRTEPTPDGGARIVLERADIERLSRAYTNPLTASEIEIVLRYPQRAPALLRLCEQASQAAVRLRQQRKSFPYDAFRHVYWSWLLTKEFGPAFSEEVTDAHEIGATYEVGASSRRMDLHNNAVGRAYAIAGVTEEDVVNRVLTDVNVMRAPAPAAPPAAP